MEGTGKQDINPVKVGLSSQEAQQQLLTELQQFANVCCRVNWLKEVLRLPYTPISCALTTVAAALLLTDYLVTGGTEATILLQAIVLFVFVVLNFILFVWEVFVLKTRRVRRLLSHIRPLTRAICPWTARSYPKVSIATKRGHFTVLAYRDRTRVNLPTSLLVRGDIVELHPEVPSPAKVALLENGESTKLTLDLGQIPPAEVYPSKNNPSTSSNTVSFIPNATPPKWIVLETPIASILDTNVTKHRSKTVLTKEKNQIVARLEVLVVTAYTISLLYNILRFYTHPWDFNGSMYELLLRQPVYTVLPIMLVPLPLVWTVVNLYGTATVTLLIENEAGFCSFKKRPFCNSLRRLFMTICRMFKLLWNHATYPNYRAFHILGSLTSVCAVDKEYLLAGGFPTPEKVFILRTEEFSDSGQGGNQRKVDDKQVEQPSVHCEEGSATFHLTVTDLGDGTDSPSLTSERLEATNPLAIKNNPEDSLSSTKAQMLDSLNAPQSEVQDTFSTVSELASIGVIKEILDISPSSDPGSGLQFDDINWQMYLSSLKPIGVNLLTTSHLTKRFSNWQLPCISSSLAQLIDQTSCACSLGAEIGVSDYSSSGFEKEAFLYSYSNAPPPSKFQPGLTAQTESSQGVSRTNPIQPHVISLVLRTLKTSNYLIMSRGSGDMVTSCCSDFWDGKDLQPLTDAERTTINEFYNRRSTTGYCIALSYNPLLAISTSLPEKTIGMFVPMSEMSRTYSESSAMESTSEEPSQLKTAAQLYESILCNQVFLGLVSFQFKPKVDVVALVEDLQIAGIRFVHFTCENEIRGKAFALKLGLETDWNCHISLASGVQYKEMTTSDLGLSRSSSTSSLGSYINTHMSNFRAKLPIGIDSVRPHIETVDNVPLQVPLYTDCSTDTIREMIEILQENSEVVLCLGNAWNRDNLSIFSQSDISLSLIPEYVNTSSCVETETCALSTSNSSQSTSVFSRDNLWPSPLEMAAYLNSTTSQLCFNRDQDVSLLSLITESRHIMSLVRYGLLYGLGSYLSISLLLLLTELFFLPPPLDGSHLFWFVFLVVPCISLSFLSTPIDPTLKSQMPTRGRKILSQKYLLVLNYSLTFALSMIVCVLLFGLTLTEICNRDIPDSDCHLLLGNVNDSSSSFWNGWRGEEEQGLLFAQDLVALFLCLYLTVHSTRFIHRTKSLWRLWSFLSWQYVCVLVAVVTLQIVYFAVSQVVAVHVRGLSMVSDLSSVPWYVWVLGFAWLAVILLPQELLKCHDKRLLFKLQTRLKLDFETKLGTYSPM